MLDPATGQPMAPEPTAPRPQEMSEQGQAGRGVQGSKRAAEEDVSRAEYPVWYIIADALGGTVEPFDVYQGPYITVPGNEGRLFIVTEDGLTAQVWNEYTNEISDEFLIEDENTAVDAAISVLPNPPANTLPYGTEREEQAESGPDTSDIPDKIPADWKPKEKEEWIPEMSEEDKIRLRGIAPIKGAKNALLKRAVPISTQQGEEICYKCKQPIQEGQPISWEGGMVAHAGACPPTQAQGQGQSRIMFPKGYTPKPPQQPAAMAQHASKQGAATTEYQADAYIEWGGQYDHRRVTLDEYKGLYEWTDWDASNELDLGRQVGKCKSQEEAKSKLERVVFNLGEPATYIQYPEGSLKKKDYLNPTEKKFLKDVGVNKDIKPDLSRPIPTGQPEAYSEADKNRLKGLGVIGRAEKVATRRKVTGSYVPTMSLTVPEESAHQVARVLADAGMRDFDVATDGTEHKSYFSFPSEAESEVAADLVYEAFAPQIAADKGGWAAWKERWERPANVPPSQVPIAKMNSKRAGYRTQHREAIAKLQRLSIKTTADLDAWIKAHPRKITKGPYAGRTEFASRFEALTELVGGDAATWILHDLATDAAAKELPKKQGAALPPPQQPPASHVRKAPTPRKPAPPKGSPDVTFPSDMPQIYMPHVEHLEHIQDETIKKQMQQEQKERRERLTGVASLKKH